MSDRPPRPAVNRRANPAGAAPPRPEAGTPASKPEAAATASPQPFPAADKPEAAAPPGEGAEAPPSGRPEPPTSVDGADTGASPREPPGAAAQDYPELSVSSGEPPGATRLGGTQAAPPFRDTIPPAPAPREPGYRGLALGLTGTLLLVLALLATAPFWAPLLPWGDQRAGADPALVERLDAERQQIGRLEQQMNAAAAAVPQLDQRVAALEQKPPPAPPDLGEMRMQLGAASSGLSELTPRLERLEGVVQAQSGGLSDLKTGLEQMAKSQQAQAADLSDLRTGLERLGQATQAQTQAQAAGLSDVKSGLDQLGKAQQAQQSALAALESRLQSFEKTTQSRAGGLTDMGLMLALMQIRNAVETGRPFAAEYNTLSSLAKNRPDIAAAAAPLADAARAGVADRAELARDLSALAQRIDAAPATADAGGWSGAALDRLRGLVRVRRADEADPGKEAAAAITVAERALASGELARAVAAIETLQGPGQGPGQGPVAAAAADWLRRARERLAVEAALQRLDALMTARLGNTAAPAPSAAAGTPG